MQDLLDEVNTRRRLLHQALELYKQRATELASAEREYKIASAKYITEQRLNGTPATLIRELAQGEPAIADLRYKRDVAQGLYDSCKEAINVYKLDLRLLDGQIEREWHSGNNE